MGTHALGQATKHLASRHVVLKPVPKLARSVLLLVDVVSNAEGQNAAHKETSADSNARVGSGSLP